MSPWDGRRERTRGDKTTGGVTRDIPSPLYPLTLKISPFLPESVYEVGSAEVGSAEVGSVEVGPAEVGPAEVGPAEVGPAEINIAEVRPDDRMLVPPLIPRLDSLAEESADARDLPSLASPSMIPFVPITAVMLTWEPVAICQTLGRGLDYTTSEQLGPLRESRSCVLHHVFGILGDRPYCHRRVVRRRGRISMYASPSSFRVTPSPW
jgi:hypothetical protein